MQHWLAKSGFLVNKPLESKKKWQLRGNNWRSTIEELEREKQGAIVTSFGRPYTWWLYGPNAEKKVHVYVKSWAELTLTDFILLCPLLLYLSSKIISSSLFASFRRFLSPPLTTPLQLICPPTLNTTAPIEMFHWRLGCYTFPSSPSILFDMLCFFTF